MSHERLAGVIADISDQPGVDAQRVVRLAFAIYAELELLDARIDALTPQVIMSGIRPLREIEKEAILTAVEKVGITEAARLLQVGQATIYRKLKEYRDEDSAVVGILAPVCRSGRSRIVDREGNTADPRMGAGSAPYPKAAGSDDGLGEDDGPGGDRAPDGELPEADVRGSGDPNAEPAAAPVHEGRRRGGEADVHRTRHDPR